MIGKGCSESNIRSILCTYLSLLISLTCHANKNMNSEHTDDRLPENMLVDQ